jgi:hypothetical protein
MELRDEIDLTIQHWGGIFANPDVREPVVAQIMAFIERAQAEEREACVRLALAVGTEPRASARTAEQIACAIRARVAAMPDVDRVA